jgi:hypothetical protein
MIEFIIYKKNSTDYEMLANEVVIFRAVKRTKFIGDQVRFYDLHSEDFLVAQQKIIQDWEIEEKLDFLNGNFTCFATRNQKGYGFIYKGIDYRLKYNFLGKSPIIYVDEKSDTEIDFFYSPLGIF